MIEGIYIHVPFCEQICVYCDFHKEIATNHKKQAYINRLIQSFEQTTEDFTNLKTIYIGGGTPSNLDDDLLEHLLKKIQQRFPISQVLEYTIEANPNDITNMKATLFAKYGINRVSLGVQSFDDDILKLMNRSHQASDIKKSINYLQQVGIDNISIDLIFGFHNQTLAQVEYDLNQAINLNIKHLSYYALILEEKSIMYYLVKQGKMRVVDEDLDYLMYNKIIDTLKDHGYHHYEISNFAFDGYESLHNMLYWTQKSYLGLGSGAHSYVRNKRFFIHPNVREFIASKTDDVCIEEYPSYALEDALIFGLRVLKGIDVLALEREFHLSLFTRYPVLQKLIDQDLLRYEEHFIRLSKKGLMLANTVFAALLEDHDA